MSFSELFHLDDPDLDFLVLGFDVTLILAVFLAGDMAQSIECVFFAALGE